MNRIFTLIASTLALLRVSAQTLNPSFCVANYPIYAVAEHGNTIYIGGQFTLVGPNTGHTALIDAGTGLLTKGMPNVEGNVNAVVSDGNGGWYVAGSFNYIGGVARKNIAHIKSDKSVDLNFNLNLQGNVVYTLAFSANTLYIGGQFANVGGLPRTNLAAYDATANAVTSWNPAPDNLVEQIKVTATTVYAIGSFQQIGGQPRSYFGAVDITTGLATSLIISGNSSSGFSGFTVSGNTIYIGGNFTTINGQSRHELAAVDINTGTPTAWAPTADNPVYSFAVSGNTVFIAGVFGTVSGVTRTGLAAFDATTGDVLPWNANSNGYCNSVVVSGSTVYIGGKFSAIGGQARNNIAAIDATSALATAWDPSANAGVNDIAVDGSKVFAGGEFTSMNAKTRNHVAAMDAITGDLLPWDPNTDGYVYSFGFKKNTVFIGGGFFTVGGQQRRKLAAVDSINGTAYAWDPEPNGVINTIDINKNVMRIGGFFSQIEGQSRIDIAAYDISGNTPALTPWSPAIPESINNQVTGILTKDTIVYIWGGFPTVNGISRYNIAAVGAKSGKTLDWNPTAGLAVGVQVKSIAINGNNIYIGGAFGQIGGQNRNNIAAVDATTGLATSWNPGCNGLISSIAVINNNLYCGGTFTVIGNQSRNNAAALDLTTGIPSGWDPNANFPVNNIVPSDSRVLLGGSFSNIANNSAAYFGVVDLTEILPLQLLSFNAKESSGIAILNWKTVNEVNTAYFNIQRSTDGVGFNNLSRINAFNTISKNTYNYTDVSVKGLNEVFYRLQMVDKDGAFTYSSVVKLNINSSPINKISIYPNPVHDQLHLQLNQATNAGNARVIITDMNGKMLVTQPVQLLQGNNSFSIPVQQLSRGMYIINIISNESRSNLSFLKQ